MNMTIRERKSEDEEKKGNAYKKEKGRGQKGVKRSVSRKGKFNNQREVRSRRVTRTIMHAQEIHHE